MPDCVEIGGVWIPAGDEQLQFGLGEDVKPHKRPVIDGEIAWQWHRIGPALELVPKERRKIAIDVGAHIGLWSRWLVREFEYVFAFEPVRRHADLIRRNVPAKYQHRLKLWRMAVGDRSADVEMIVERKISGRSHIRMGLQDGNGTDSAQMIALDDLNIGAVDLLKIDVEGYERRVLTGAERTIRECKPLIVIEQLGHEERYGESRNAALDLLKEWGAVELRDDIKGDHYVGWRDR